MPEHAVEIEMPYSPSHKPKTRIRIVNAASALFKKHGFETVSYTHLTLPTIYSV